MELKYDYWTGHANDDLVARLKRSVNTYLVNHKKIKIGITNNPETRKSAHKRHETQWDAMHVKYETSSRDYVTYMEAILVEYFWDYIENEIGGGGGNYGNGPYYLYVLIKKH